MNRGAQQSGAELPHGIDNVAIMRCNVERKRDARAPTGELHGHGPVHRRFTEGADAKNTRQISLLSMALNSIGEM